MIDEINPTYHEIDFVVPIHRFKINFSYSKEKGMGSFVREFTLRLINIAPMKPTDVAIFLGFTVIEMDEAISDLINKGDLEFSDDGELTLTHTSKKYFQGLGDSPTLPAITDDHISLWYELNSFDCIKKTYSESGWNSCIELNVDDKTISNSPKFIKSVFHKNFYRYFEENRILNSESDRNGKQPNIYSVGEVIRLSRAPLRLSTQFNIDQDGRPTERKDFDLFTDSSRIHELITQYISHSQKLNNFEDIAFNAVTTLKDDLTLGFVTSDSIDVEGYTLAMLLALAGNDATIPLIGPIYSKYNWDRVIGAVEKIKKNKKPIELIWITPSDPFWGKSHRLNTCISELLRNEMSKGEKSQRIYSSNIYIQMDRHFDRRLINDYKHEFKDFKSNIFALIEGFLNGNVEVLLIPGQFVAVVYHFSMPGVLPVTFPAGFTSIDKDRIELIENVLSKYIGPLEVLNNENILGLLSQIEAR